MGAGGERGGDMKSERPAPPRPPYFMAGKEGVYFIAFEASSALGSAKSALSLSNSALSLSRWISPGLFIADVNRLHVRKLGYIVVRVSSCTVRRYRSGLLPVFGVNWLELRA